MAAPELNFVELMRWTWRQLCSMRTALVLLLMLALAAVPGSVIPQSDVDAFAVARWKEQHPDLTPIYEWLGLFDVFSSVWFAAIYLLLVTSLMGCILPRCKVYWRAMRARPPKAPRNLLRLPESASYRTEEPIGDVLARAEEVLRKRRFRVVPATTGEPDSVSAERGYLREAGNLVFHISILIVMAGFAVGSLFGYRGGVIVVQGQGFSNNLSQYDDFAPGAMTGIDDLEPFSLQLEEFDLEWIQSGPRKGMAQKFVASLSYTEEPGATEKSYDLRVNHPLSIGGTDVFLIGHGYAPSVTVRDANGDISFSGPVVCLPEEMATFRSFCVIKAPNSQPDGIGLEGYLYPTFALIEGDPQSIFGDDRNPRLSLLAYTGDLGLGQGTSQSVYVLDKSQMTQLTKEDGSMFRVDLFPGESIELPDGAGTVTFEGIRPWVRIQLSKTPGMMFTLGGVVLALLGLLGSLFIRPRRAWVRAREEDGETVVELAVLDRSGVGDSGDEIVELVAALRGVPEEEDRP